MESNLPHMLLDGSAYERFRGTVERAQMFGRRFMETIFCEELYLVGFARIADAVDAVVLRHR